jgi:hypothetical protein
MIGQLVMWFSKEIGRDPVYVPSMHVNHRAEFYSYPRDLPASENYKKAGASVD